MTECTSMTTAEQLAQKFPFKKTMLALCVGAAIQPAAWAQTEASSTETPQSEDEALEEITVYGVRASLRSASELKRNADTHVDAITATDIGSLPDVSVLEAIQRVPGVSIERFASANDPDHFSTEGSGVTLRGLPNVRSEFNGRDTFSANVGRLGSVEIYKNQTADQVEGGISGIVNLNTRKPFDFDGQKVSFSASGSFGDLEEELTPNFSGLYSDRFKVAGGEIGVLVSYANSELDFRSDGVELGRPGPAGSGGVNLPETSAIAGGGQAFIPINGGIRANSTERDREGASIALQYQNEARTFEATAEYIRSDSLNSWLEHAFFSDDGRAQSGFEGTGATASSTFSDGVFQSGTLENIQGAIGPQTRRSTTNSLVEDFSLALNFQVSDRLRLGADFQYVQSERDNVDLAVFGGLDVNNSFRPVDNAQGIDNLVEDRSDFPDVTFLAPGTSSQSDAAFFTDPANFFLRAGLDHNDDADGDEFAFRFDGEYDLDGDFLKSVQTGVRFAERDQTTRNSTFLWGNVSETWSGGRALFDGTPGLGFRADPNISSSFIVQPNQVEIFDFGDFHAGSVTGIPGGQALFPAARLVDSDRIAFDSEIAPFRNSGTLEGRAGADADGFLPAEVTSTVEENTSLYVRLNFGAGGENRLDGNVGLRYIRQDTTVAGGFIFPQPTAFSDTSRFLPGEITPEILAFANGASREGNIDSTFDKVLPSLNLKYEVNDNLIARFGASSTVSYPNIGDLAFNFQVGTATTQGTSTNNIPNNDAQFNGFTATSGNPFLQPIEADNFDLSAEYYFGDGNFVSLGLFHKEISNFTVAGQQNIALENNGVTQNVLVTSPVNAGDADLQGVEFAYQQFFSNGFGLQFNYTYLNPSDVPQQNTRPLSFTGQADIDRTAIVFEGLPLQGLSENQFNLVGLYQGKKIEARLAYNWRDDYLLTTRQVNLGLPVFSEARGQLDGSIFYSINDNIEIGLQGTNLLQDEVVNNLQVDQEGTQVFRTSFVFDRRFTLLVRANF